MTGFARVLAATVLVTAASSSLAITPDIIVRGWQPSVEIAGSGDAATAVTNLRQIADLQQVVLKHTEFHPQTQQFIDDLWSSLQSFNLNKFYRLLPLQDGDWRELKVYGARNGDLYRVGPQASKVGYDVSAGPERMGDMSLVVRAKRLESKNETHYLLTNDMELGLGQVRWPSVQQATAETLRIVVDGAPTFSSPADAAASEMYRQKVIKMNPDLGPEDVNILAPLWAAFPAMWNLLSQTGHFENVIYHDLSLGYRQLEASFVLDPELMKKRYPALINHVLKMNRLFEGSIRLVDSRGELLSMDIDSKTMRAKIHAFVANGRIVPVKGGRVIVDAPPIPDGKPWELTAYMNGTMSILGVVTNIQNMKARIQVLSEPDGLKAVAQVTQVPDVSVRGNALGFMPTSMIDIVLPKNLDQIIKDFFTVACKGNDGKGILIGARFQQAEANQTARLTVKSQFEGLDNFFVRIGMGIVSDRVLPDPDVSKDLRRLVFDTQEAFVHDLNGFANIESLVSAEQPQQEMKKAL